MKNKLILFSLLIIGLSSSCKKKEEDNGPTQQVIDDVPVASDTLKKGTFVGYDHGLSGKSFILKDGNDRILRLTEYNMTPAPDADVYLSKNASYSAGNVVKIADLTGGYTNSSLNLTIPSTVNYTEYPYVIVWCTQFSANFGVATLTNP
jgi:hypothetical protein